MTVGEESSLGPVLGTGAELVSDLEAVKCPLLGPAFRAGVDRL